MSDTPSDAFVTHSAGDDYILLSMDNPAILDTRDRALAAFVTDSSYLTAIAQAAQTVLQRRQQRQEREGHSTD